MERDVETLQAFADQYHTASDESVQGLRKEFTGLQKELLEQISASREKMEAMEKAETACVAVDGYHYHEKPCSFADCVFK